MCVCISVDNKLIKMIKQTASRKEPIDHQLDSLLTGRQERSHGRSHHTNNDEVNETAGNVRDTKNNQGRKYRHEEGQQQLGQPITKKRTIRSNTSRFNGDKEGDFDKIIEDALTRKQSRKWEHDSSADNIKLPKKHAKMPGHYEEPHSAQLKSNKHKDLKRPLDKEQWELPATQTSKNAKIRIAKVLNDNKPGEGGVDDELSWTQRGVPNVIFNSKTNTTTMNTRIDPSPQVTKSKDLSYLDQTLNTTEQQNMIVAKPKHHIKQGGTMNRQMFQQVFHANSSQLPHSGSYQNMLGENLPKRFPNMNKDQIRGLEPLEVTEENSASGQTKNTSPLRKYKNELNMLGSVNGSPNTSVAIDENVRNRGASPSFNKRREGTESNLLRQNSRIRRNDNSSRAHHIEDLRQSDSFVPNKKHVHFRDDVEGNSLCIIYEIESYKKYYSVGNDANCACTCLIF